MADHEDTTERTPSTLLTRRSVLAVVIVLTFIASCVTTQAVMNQFGKSGSADAAMGRSQKTFSSITAVSPATDPASVSTPTVVPTTLAAAADTSPVETTIAPPSSAPSPTTGSKSTTKAAGSPTKQTSAPATPPTTASPATTAATSPPSTAAPAPVFAAATDDNTTSGTQRFTYAGNWGVCSNCSGAYGGTGNYHYASDISASATYNFTGRQGKVYIVFGEGGGLVSLKVDGKEVARWDTTAASRQGRWWDSGVLADGAHAMSVTIVGKGSSGSSTVAVDRAEVWR